MDLSLCVLYNSITSLLKLTEYEGERCCYGQSFKHSEGD